MTRLGEYADFTHIVVTADALQTALLVQDRFDFISGKAGFSFQVEDDCRIDISAAGAHDQAFQGCHAHGGINTLSAFDGGHAGAIPQMQCNHVQRIRWSIQI